MVSSGIKFGIAGVAASIVLMKDREKAIIKATATQIAKSTIELKEEVKASIGVSRAEPRSIDTGEFLTSIKSKSSKNTGIVSSNKPQALFMEFGTSKIHERRHFRNSLDRKKKKIENDLDKAIENII